MTLQVSLPSRLKNAIGLGFMPVVRGLESLLSPALLRVLLWPLGALSAWNDLRQQQKFLEHYARLPASMAFDLKTRDCFWRARTSFHLSRFLSFWPDRFTHPRWSNRFLFPAREQLRQWQQEHRPVILATLHFGPLHLLGYWLRSQGIVAATLIGEARAERAPTKQSKDRLSLPADVPTVFCRDELAQAIKFLAAGGCLIVAMDVPGSKNVDVTVSGTVCSLATGAIRMAHSTGATLVPCAIVEEQPWRFAIYTGSPVPAKWIESSPDLGNAAQHLLTEIMRVVESKPEQCQTQFLSTLSPGAPALIS